MSKSIKKVFYEHLSFMHLLEAHERASKGKKNKKDVILFEIDLESNLSNLLTKIKNKTYHIGKYHEFEVKEPKKRIIKSLPYVDRIVHQWYVEEFIKPFFLPRFISDSYACIENKGAHKAVLKVKQAMQIMKRKYNDYYILKCDIKKYFYSINKDILYSILKKRMRDKELLAFTNVLIYDDGEKKGIPIGNYTSQFFANIYLNELDHFIKEKLKVRFYVRYMDDFILLLKSKEEAIRLKKVIEKFLEENLDLELNRKSKYYPNKMGVDFCGYRIFETHILLRTRSKTKIKRLIKSWNTFYEQDKLCLEQVILRWNSWRGHASHANSYNLRKRYWNKINFKEYLEISCKEKLFTTKE